MNDGILTEYQNLIVERYGKIVYPDGEHPVSYEMYNDYLAMLNMPKGYQNEKEMLAYAEAHPDATLKDLLHYFVLITPPGLAPGDDGADLLDDDEEPATEFEIQMIDLLARWFDYTKENEVEDATAFAAACEEQGLEDAALEFVQGREKLTAQDLWHWLARVQPNE